MPKLHASLSPKTNILLILLWGTVSAILFAVLDPHVPFLMGLTGAFFGMVIGIMQHWGFSQSMNQLSTTGTLLEIREVLRATVWGGRAISLIYISKIVLAILAFLLAGHSFLRIVLAYVAGYMVLMFVREVVTLADVFQLDRLKSKQEVSDPTK